MSDLISLQLVSILRSVDNYNIFNTHRQKPSHTHTHTNTHTQKPS